MVNPDVITALVFGAAGFIFVLFNIAGLGRLLRGRRAGYAAKNAPYECGEIVTGDARGRFNPRFLLLAIVFVLFDVEVAFLFPWGVAFKESGPTAFFEMLVFLGILLVGYFWFWKIGELRWILSDEATK